MIVAANLRADKYLTSFFVKNKKAFAKFAESLENLWLRGPDLN